MPVVLPPVAANTPQSQLPNMAHFVGFIWESAGFCGADRAVDVDMIRCLDIGCLCARINIHKT